MTELWDDFRKHLVKQEVDPDDLLTDLHQLIKFEEKERGEIHSLSLRIHTLQAATQQLVFGEGIAEAEELMDWTIELLDILDQEDDQALHFILELEAAEKTGKKWVAKHHEKILAEIQLERLTEDHFILQVKEKLRELIDIYHNIKKDLDGSDQQRIQSLIQATIHGLESLK